MKFKIILALLVILIASDVFSQTTVDKGYIRLHYNGEQSKPYPRILLYLAGSIAPTKDNVYTHKLEITSESFDLIRKAIEERKYIGKDSILIDENTYQFLISNNGETTAFLTPYVPRIRQLFNIIIGQLENSDNEIRIKDLLEDTISRVIYDNGLKKN